MKTRSEDGDPSNRGGSDGGDKDLDDGDVDPRERDSSYGGDENLDDDDVEMPETETTAMVETEIWMVVM